MVPPTARSARPPSVNRVDRRVLAWASAALLLAVAIAGAISAIDAHRARLEVRALVESAEESLTLAGRIGRQLSRERSLVLEALTESPERVPEAAAMLQAGDASLVLALQSVEARLRFQELEDWRRLRGEIDLVRAEITRSLEEIASGDAPSAEARLDENAKKATAVYEGLDRLTERNREEAAVLLAEADERLQRLVVVQSGGAVTLLVAMGLGFLLVARLVRSDLERIEQTNQELDAFAGRVAHDVRNAIAPMANAAQILRVARGPETLDALADQLSRSAEHTSRLLDGLLAFSRGGAARGERGEACPRKAAQAVLEELQPLIGRLGARVDARVEASRLAMDPGLLHIVLANVAGNAVKFLDGGAQREVRILGSVGAERYELVVEDTGSGIAEEALEHVFEPFYRAPGSSAPGTGLGLATVWRILTAHGGEIAVDSRVGRGTTVRLSIPIHPSPGADPLPRSGPREPAAVALQREPRDGTGLRAQ